MHILCCADHNYIMPTGVMICSVCENNKDSEIVFHIVSDSSVTKEDKESLKANGHTYVDGICTECKEKDPNYKPEGSEGSNDDEIPSNTQETNEV